MMKNILTISIATICICTIIGCSGQSLKRSGYETLRNISDLQNQDDPRYDPGPRPGGFETYQQQREELLHPQQPAIMIPATPEAQSEP